MAPKTLPADFDGWDDAPPQDSTVAQKQQAARAVREARAPSWAQAFAPSTSAALASGKNPLQDAATLAAPLKDLAALPANIAAGLLGFGGSSPGEGGLATREAMAGAPTSPYAETQNQRVVGGLALAGSALGGPFLRAVPAAAQAAIPEGASTLAALASRGGTMAKNAGRLVGAGVAESVPAAAYQAATGDVGGGLASLALGGALRPLSGLPKAAPAAADMVERTAGALSGVPGHELAAIGPLGMSAYGREVKAAAGNPNAAYDLGQKLADRIKNFDQYLPNAADVDAMVAKLPPIKANDITAALERSKVGMKSPADASSFSYRFSSKKDPMSDWGHAMFADDRNAVSGIYGKNEFHVGKNDLADVKSIEGKIRSAWSKADLSRTMNATDARTFEGLSADEVVDQLVHVKDIVSSAKGYDSPLVSWLYEDVIEPMGLKGIKTPDGAVVFDPSIIKAGSAEPKITYATPADKATDDAIGQLVDMVNKSADANGNIPATLARQIKQRYDAAVGDAFGKESSAYVTALKNGRHDIAKALENAAEESGIPEYKQAMQDYTRRLSAVDKISSQLGATDATRRARAESFVSNLYGKNKTQQQKNMADLADILGEDFAQQAKAIGTAKVAMPGGALPIFPTQTTGRSMLGLGAAGSLASGSGALAGAPIAALSSPMLASVAIPAARGLANFATGPTADRATLASLASLRAYLQAENAQQ